MRRIATVLSAAAFLWLPGQSFANPGNVLTWFANSATELTFTCQSAVVRLELLDEGVARVRLTTNNVAFSSNPSFTIVRNWPRPPAGITDGDPLVFTNAGIRVEVSKSPFRLTFKKPDGTVLLSELNSFGLDYRGTTNYANFSMPAGEQFYGLGMRFFKPFSQRGQTNYLYNLRAETGGGGQAVTDMAVPLVLSSKGYGLFMDNTFPQLWNFNVANADQWWLVRTDGGELNYYFFAGDSLADVLNRYTLATGRSPIPPRWTFGYQQARNGYHNWGDVYQAKDGFRTNDLPCDALFLDFQWFGPSPCDIGALTWNSGAFPNPAQNIASLAADGVKMVLITEPYINDQKPTFTEARNLKYLMADNYPARDIPSTVPGFFCNAGYMDFNNPAARGWFFEKIKPRILEGNAGQWTDLGEPQYDGSTSLSDYSYDGKREIELHNVHNLLWHQAIAEGYATNFPNDRVWIYSRSGFAGSQRYGAAVWSNDVGTDWPTFAAHLNAMNNFSLSGFSYFGSDIGGYWAVSVPNDELYIRWFEYGAFSPVFRAHGFSNPPSAYKAVAPYDFGDPMVMEICRVLMKLRYRLLPYIYTTAKETFDTGLPLCRPLPLAFPADSLVVNNGTQFMFGPNLMVAPITTSNLTSRSVYLPAGNWIDHWTGRALAGPVTTNWPAPLAQTPLFWRDNSITPLGPYVASTQFDDGTQRAARIYCSTSAAGTLYDDDGASNGYRTNEFATTAITASKAGNVVFIQIGSPVGSYSTPPATRAWTLELYCTNQVFNVVADGVPAAYDLDAAEKLLRVQLPAAPFAQPHSVYVYLDLAAPAPYGARLKAVDRPYLDQAGRMWSQDRAYAPGEFGFSTGTQFRATDTIALTDDDILYQSERYAVAISAMFDAPNGRYETQLLEAETANNSAGHRLMNVFIESQQVLTNFDIFVAAGGKNRAVTRTFTNTVTDTQLKIDLVAAGIVDPNARISAVAVRKIADADGDADGLPDWWEAANSVTNPATDDDGDGFTNVQEFLARTDPRDAKSALAASVAGNVLSWTSVPGLRYRVQISGDLATWTDVVPDLIANSSTATWTDPGPLPDKRFYRILALP